MSKWKDTDADDEEQEEALVTFGLVRTDLIEILAMIRICSDALGEVLQMNDGLPSHDKLIMLTAIENYQSLYYFLSMDDEIPEILVERKVRHIQARTDLLRQAEFLRIQLAKTLSKQDLCSMKPDPAFEGIYGDENT